MLPDARYAEGTFAVLRPQDNEACGSVARAYDECLAADESFAVWTLESFVADLEAAGAGSWLQAFTDRYLAFVKVERVVGSLAR